MIDGTHVAGIAGFMTGLNRVVGAAAVLDAAP
jgi:hypothetical protein